MEIAFFLPILVLITYPLFLRFLNPPPHLYAIIGGVLAHIAMVSGSNASSLPKSLAALWPVNTMALFAYAVAITSAQFLLALFVFSLLEKSRALSPTSILAIGLSAYNFCVGFAVANSTSSLPALNQSAIAFVFAGLAALALIEALALATVSSAFKAKSLIWPIVAVAYILGHFYYYVAPIYAVELQPRVVLAVAYTLVAASCVYVMLRNNIIAASKLGGFLNFKFWLLLFAGVMLYAAAEVLIALYHPDVVKFLHV